MKANSLTLKRNWLYKIHQSILRTVSSYIDHTTINNDQRLPDKRYLTDAKQETQLFEIRKETAFFI